MVTKTIYSEDDINRIMQILGEDSSLSKDQLMHTLDLMPLYYGLARTKKSIDDEKNTGGQDRARWLRAEKRMLKVIEIFDEFSSKLSEDGTPLEYPAGKQVLRDIRDSIVEAEVRMGKAGNKAKTDRAQLMQYIKGFIIEKALGKGETLSYNNQHCDGKSTGKLPELLHILLSPLGFKETPQSIVKAYIRATEGTKLSSILNE